MCEGVDGDNDGVGEEVTSANEIHGIWILHRNLLANLHHPEDDDQVGAASSQSYSSIPWESMLDGGK